jgi:acyl dehydratase
MAAAHYLEDFAPGQTFASGGVVNVDARQIKAFAAEFDPQPFHLDESAAAKSFFGELVASGWHTAALTMKLLVTSELHIAGGLIGAGTELKWPRPVRPGDTLRVVSEVVEVRPSNSRPNQGIVKMRSTTLNQKDEPVQILVANMVVPRRPA